MPLTQLASQLRIDCVKNIQFFGGRLTEVGRERARGKSDLGKWIAFSARGRAGKVGLIVGEAKVKSAFASSSNYERKRFAC
jgi:hypothetical protein